MSSAVIVGASAGVGRAVARVLARDGRRLILVARDARDLEATAADLKLRFGVECWHLAEDITRSDWDVVDFAKTCQARLERVDALVIAAGAISPDDLGPNPDAVRPMAEANFVGPARIGAAFAQLMSAQQVGTIVLFSSIAAAAPRAKNAAYSAAKSALETYARALRHALADSGVEVLYVALGYVDTAMTYGLQVRFPVVSPEAAAEDLARRLRRTSVRSGKHHFPRWWWLVTTVLRHLPWFIYRRLRF